LTFRGLNSNPEHFDTFTFILVSCGESRLLVSWCACSRCDIAGSDENHGMSRRPGAEDQAIGSLGNIVCSLYRAQGDEESGFLG
jgi:hypothetical protein